MSKQESKTTIPLAVIDRIMRDNLSGKKISKEAKIEFEKVLLEIAKTICKNAGENTDKAKRKTVLPEDIKSI